MSYAAKTSVPVARSKAELDQMLTRYKAERRAVLEEQGRAVVMFERDGRRVQIELVLPASDAEEFAYRRGPYKGEVDESRWEQACRQRWRALTLVVKAKLEAVEAGIETFEEAFLAHIVLPGRKGGTVGGWLLPQLEAAFKTDRMPPLLGDGS